MRSGQVGYQSKCLTLRNNLKLESSFYLILVKSYGHIIFKSVYSTPSRERNVPYDQSAKLN